jgi:hypothetical protein
MHVYCVYPAISKSPKQLPNCLKIAETNVVLIIFNGVICDVSVSCNCVILNTNKGDKINLLLFIHGPNKAFLVPEH